MLSDTIVIPGYSIIIPTDTLTRATDYLQTLRAGQAQAGALLCFKVCFGLGWLGHAIRRSSSASLFKF